jgi:hypothetical protein
MLQRSNTSKRPRIYARPKGLNDLGTDVRSHIKTFLSATQNTGLLAVQKSTDDPCTHFSKSAYFRFSTNLTGDKCPSGMETTNSKCCVANTNPELVRAMVKSRRPSAWYQKVAWKLMEDRQPSSLKDLKVVDIHWFLMAMSENLSSSGSRGKRIGAYMAWLILEVWPRIEWSPYFHYFSQETLVAYLKIIPETRGGHFDMSQVVRFLTVTALPEPYDPYPNLASLRPIDQRCFNLTITLEPFPFNSRDLGHLLHCQNRIIAPFQIVDICNKVETKDILHLMGDYISATPYDIDNVAFWSLMVELCTHDRWHRMQPHIHAYVRRTNTEIASGVWRILENYLDDDITREYYQNIATIPRMPAESFGILMDTETSINSSWLSNAEVQEVD